MLSKQELREWLDSVDDEDGIFIDEGGLTLCSESGVCIEVGGDPDEESDDAN